MNTSNVERTPSRLVDCWDVEAMSKSGVGVKKVSEMEVKRRNPNRNCGCAAVSFDQPLAISTAAIWWLRVGRDKFQTWSWPTSDAMFAISTE